MFWKSLGVVEELGCHHWEVVVSKVGHNQLGNASLDDGVVPVGHWISRLQRVLHCFPDKIWQEGEEGEDCTEDHLEDQALGTFGRVGFSVETAAAEVAEGHLAQIEPDQGNELGRGGHPVPEVLLLIAYQKAVLVDRDVLPADVPLIHQPALLELHRGHLDLA